MQQPGETWPEVQITAPTPPPSWNNKQDNSGSYEQWWNDITVVIKIAIVAADTTRF